MTGPEKLLRALDDLEALQQASRSLEPELRREILKMRRKISAQDAYIFSLADEAFPDQPVRERYRSECSRLRSASAVHLASWPVVIINREDPGYVASVTHVRDAYRYFCGWVRKALANQLIRKI